MSANLLNFQMLVERANETGDRDPDEPFGTNNVMAHREKESQMLKSIVGSVQMQSGVRATK